MFLQCHRHLSNNKESQFLKINVLICSDVLFKYYFEPGFCTSVATVLDFRMFKSKLLGWVITTNITTIIFDKTEKN